MAKKGRKGETVGSKYKPRRGGRVGRVGWMGGGAAGPDGRNCQPGGSGGVLSVSPIGLFRQLAHNLIGFAIGHGGFHFPNVEELAFS